MSSQNITLIRTQGSLYNSADELAASGGGGGDTTQYSGFNLSGGTVIAGPYFSMGETSAPADSKWFAFNGGTNTIDYSSGAFRINYKAGDGNNVGCSVKVNQAGVYNELYMEFDVEVDNTLGENVGWKFIKVKGESGTGYANCTFGVKYGGGADQGDMTELSYGDGTGISNDTTNTISYDEGLQASANGRNAGIIQKATPHGRWLRSEWNPTSPILTTHHVRLAFRYNSGDTALNEVPDGGVYLEIDGEVIVDAGNFYNSHYSNTKAINTMAIGDISQDAPNDYSVRYFNIKVLTGGFSS